MKLCRKCNTEKPLTEFHRHSKRPDGRQDWCRTCVNGFRSAWEKTPQGKISLQRSWRQYQRNSGVRKVRNLVARLIRRGKISRQTCCVCDAVNADAHHEDYLRPLDLVWLCGAHHRQRHAAIKQGIALEHSF